MSSFGDLNRVNTNIQSMDSQLSLNRVNRNLAENQLRLSTGLRINRAEDDAAGFSIANKLDSRIAALNQGLQNVGDAKSVLDIAESSFDTIMDNLIEMKALATQAANDTLGEAERGFISDQIEELGNEINDIAEQTVFQDLDLLNGSDGSYAGELELTFQVGERTTDTITASIDAVNVNELFDGSSASGQVDASTADFSSTQVGFGVTGAGGTATVTGVDVRDSGGNTIADVSGLTIETGSGDSDDLQALADAMNTLFEGEDLSLEASVDGNGIEVSNTDTDESYTVVIHGDLDGDSSADVETETVAEGTFNENAAGQGEMDLSSWSASDFRDFIADVDTAIEEMSSRVNSVGIAQSSLSVREVTLSQSISANQSAVSRIMDADFAKEQSESVRLQILQQTATSALAQANIGPQSVLGFLA